MTNFIYLLALISKTGTKFLILKLQIFILKHLGFDAEYIYMQQDTYFAAHRNYLATEHNFLGKN